MEHRRIQGRLRRAGRSTPSSLQTRRQGHGVQKRSSRARRLTETAAAVAEAEALNVSMLERAAALSALQGRALQALGNEPAMSGPQVAGTAAAAESLSPGDPSLEVADRRARYVAAGVVARFIMACCRAERAADVVANGLVDYFFRATRKQKLSFKRKVFGYFVRHPFVRTSVPEHWHVSDGNSG